jgi:hypothetical protein
LTSDYFLAIETGSTRAKGKLLLPRFSIERDISGLPDILKTMGIPLFNPDSLTEVIKGTPVRLLMRYTKR